MKRRRTFALLLGLLCATSWPALPIHAQILPGMLDVRLDAAASPHTFPLFARTGATPIWTDPGDADPVLNAAAAFAKDIQKVSGRVPISLDQNPRRGQVIIVGTLEHSVPIKTLVRAGALDASRIQGRWEASLVTVVRNPFPGVQSALVIAGSDPRGAAFALFDLSRAIGISPWTWWADVPVHRHTSCYISTATHIQDSPAVQYRGIFINDEDWGLRPWAAKKMDPEINNIGPKAYARVFELLIRLHANTLWPAMHPGSTPFHDIAENSIEAKKWGIVMGASHSEALTRNNVGEWNVKRDGPWNYQSNSAAIKKYWAEGLARNGRFENVYTVGMRGQHDSGLEATGDLQVKARLVEKIISDQQALLQKYVNPDLTKVPQVIWLYKESIDLYRARMKIPDDVTLGWTDDNYGYIRQMPDAEEQQRAGGSALYYHVSYWGSPHDYLWLCSTPPALIQEELTKAWDHGIRKLWMLNVGDIKPAEQDIDYFLQMAWKVPEFRRVPQRAFLLAWYSEQFSPQLAKDIVPIMERYYQLNFVRKPEFMGFNGYNDEVQRTAFNPLASGDQNRTRIEAWSSLSKAETALSIRISRPERNAYFELVRYPVQAAAQQNLKFLWTDRSYLDRYHGDSMKEKEDVRLAELSFDRIQDLTHQYNALGNGRWEGMMSSHPRDRHVFEMPQTAENSGDADAKLPQTWGDGGPFPTSHRHGFFEMNGVVAIAASHYARIHNTVQGHWQQWPDLGLSGPSVGVADPGKTPEASWVRSPSPLTNAELNGVPSAEYRFSTTSDGSPVLSLYLLPTFPVDSQHRLRYAFSLDGKDPVELDADAGEGDKPDVTPWDSNVLRNALIQTVDLGVLESGPHTLKLYYGDPGVIFQYLTVRFPSSAPAYPFPPETGNPYPIEKLH